MHIVSLKNFRFISLFRSCIFRFSTQGLRAVSFSSVLHFSRPMPMPMLFSYVSRLMHRYFSSDRDLKKAFSDAMQCPPLLVLILDSSKLVRQKFVRQNRLIFLFLRVVRGALTLFLSSLGSAAPLSPSFPSGIRYSSKPAQRDQDWSCRSWTSFGPIP